MKLVLAFFTAVFFYGVCFAAAPFLGWDCSDNTALKTALSKSNEEVSAKIKVSYALMVAENENKSNIDSLSKCWAIAEKTLKENGIKTPEESVIFNRIVVYFYNRPNESVAKEIAAHHLSKKNWFFKENYIINKKLVIVSDIEYKETLFSLLKRKIQRNSTNRFMKNFNEYMNICAEEDSKETVKNLQTLYRLALPKLANNEKMKPIVVAISLALKGYGVEVK